MLTIDNLSYRIGDRLLLERASATIPAGHRVGLIGRNGAGKSTLLKLILGEAQPEAGATLVRPGARTGRLAQEAPSGDRSLIDFVLAADEERARLLAETEHATDPGRIAELHTRLADIDAHTAPARAATILAGLGFDAAAQARPLSSFSGGWRMRVALAAILFAEPDLLLLDEPSNHLDLEATIWLEDFLKSYPRTLLVVSHDRNLLNNVVTHILHLERGGLSLYKGGYDQFEAARRQKMAHQAAMHSRQEAQRRHLQAFVDRFRAKASKARQAQSRLKMLARMTPIAAVMEDGSVAFRFPEPEPLSPPLLVLDAASAGYAPDKPVLSHLDLRIDMDDRIALIGANGNGKSTLARLLSGNLQPLAGKLRQSGKLKVGYFAQHQMEQLQPNRTAFEHLQDLAPQMLPVKIRARLGQFGFAQGKADQKVETLSGGEKARLVFALITYAAPQLLILDEPTNHLDIDAREALVQALNDYEGAVILISHDRHTVELCADRLWLVEDGRVQPFDGDLDEYARRLGDKRRDGPSAKARAQQSRRDNRRAAAEARAAAAPLRRQAREAEALLTRLTKRKTEVDAFLAGPSVYDGDKDRLAELLKERGDLERRIDAAETEWLATQEALESAT